MNNWRKQFNKNALIKSLSSLKITVGCLALLFILTFWGTIAQIDQGLYGAQERFFFSWYFLAAGFIPFPGAKLVFWVFFINLLCVSLTRFVYKWSHAGILIIHGGLLTYFVAAFITYMVTVESNLSLYESEGANVSQSYRDWELSIWPTPETYEKQVSAIDAVDLTKEKNIQISQYDIKLMLEDYYPNATAYRATAGTATEFINQSGIGTVTKIPVDKEPEKNMPALMLRVESKGDIQKLLLYAGEEKPITLKLPGQELNFQLRRKRFELPFMLTLKDFQKEIHPGTEIAKSYKSLVSIEHDGIKRNVLIWMNHPLRFKNFTVYQASYSIDQWGRERSTLTVVENSGRILPYVASLLTFTGLVFHFMAMAFKPKGKNA